MAMFSVKSEIIYVSDDEDLESEISGLLSLKYFLLLFRR